MSTKIELIVNARKSKLETYCFQCEEYLPTDEIGRLDPGSDEALELMLSVVARHKARKGNGSHSLVIYRSIRAMTSREIRGG